MRGACKGSTMSKKVGIFRRVRLGSGLACDIDDREFLLDVERVVEVGAI